MPSHQCNHTAIIRWLLFVCLLYSGSSLEAQIEAPTPVPSQEASSQSNDSSDDSELKIHNYQLKHAKAAEVLKLFKQLHGVKNAATIDERTNSIVFLANETNARELRESLAVLVGDAPHPIIPPTPVVQGSSPQAPAQAKYQALPEKSKPAGPFRKFTFKHAKVADVVKILRELTGANIDNENMEGFAVDERTNSVIWKVKDEWTSQHWEETLLTLDGESSTSKTQKTPSPYAPTPASGSAQSTQTFTFSMGLERGESLESLKQRYSELEHKTHQLADKLKQSKSPSEPERTELKTAVRKSFEARQALQRAELADLAQRMQSMQQSIDMRDKLADKVIERRVEDLLNPSLKWESIQASELVPTTAGEVDLSTPQATLDAIDRYSVDHPMGVPVECYTEEALQELSGVMLQQLCFMSGLSQVGLKTGGVIGIKDNAPIVAGTAPSFHLSVDALLKEHSLPTPPEECTKAFELLAKLTLGAAFGNDESLVKPDRELFRLAAGILKSPKEFLPKAGELSKRFNDIPGDTESPKKESKAQPNYLIEIDGEEATATQFVDTDKPSVPMSFKLQRINQRWLVSEAFSDEILDQMISSMSLVLDGVSASEGNTQGVADSSHPTIPPPNNSAAPQELLDAVEQRGKSGSYEDFVTLFNDEGVRDLAGSLLMSAMMQTSMDELSRQQTTGGLSEVDPGTVAVRKVLQRWLPQSLSADQREYVGKGLSTMMSSIGGASPDQATLKEFVISMRKSVEGITDHRKFCVEMMQAYEKLTTKPFVYFGNADQKNEWQISQFGERAIATLIDGSPGMATTITLQQASGNWRISSLFNELVVEAKPITPSPSSTATTQSNAKTVTRRYSVGSFVTESFFTDKDYPETDEVYAKREAEIEQSLQDLVKTVTATCTQPPKFVQVISGSRCLLIGHTEAGHQEIADFMSDIGISNDRIRLRVVPLEITKDDVKSLGIELTQNTILVAPEATEKLRTFQKNKVTDSQASSSDLKFVPMDETIRSGVRTHMKSSNGPTPIAARIVPGTKEVQIRIDFYGYSNGSEQYHPLFRTMIDGQSMLLDVYGDSYWLVHVDIVRDRVAENVDAGHSSGNTSTSSDVTVGPKYSGHPISWWLDSYWDDATASPKTAENSAQEYVAAEAILKLREKPECEAAIEAALAKWFASVEHEVNEIQLVRAAKCFVVAAGTENQELAVAYLFKIWRQLPTLTLEKQIELASDQNDETELNALLKQLVLNDELAIQFAERLTNGTSSDRSFVTYYLFSSTGLKDEKDPKVAELNAWLHNHCELFIPAFAAALKDESEHVRWFSLFSLSSLVGLDLKHANVLSTLTSVIESDASPKVRCLAIEMISSKETLSVAKSQNIEITPLMIKTLESDSSVDVRYAVLGALMAIDKDSELVHATLLEGARCKERLQVENALSLMLRNHEAGDRPQSIDELIELLSDPEWGTKVEVNYNNWSTHHRWARQYAIAILGEYAAHAHRAIPTLEAELARNNNKDTLSFATKALDSVRGYCPDLPIDKLQGEWEFVSMQWPEGSSPFFDLQASSDQPSSVITISGTQLKLGDRVLAELSHYRSGSRQGVALLLDPDGKKLHCHGGHNFKGGSSAEYKANATPSPELLILEVSELLNNWDATQATKQIYEFRPVKK